jgi:peptide/nickel transport system permease protein
MNAAFRRDRGATRRPRIGLRQRWRQLRPVRPGLLLTMLLAAIGFFAPVLANDAPLVCRHEGAIYFPAITELFQQVPLIGRFVRQPAPFRLVDFSPRTDLDPTGWAIWPPVPYGPQEMAAAALAPPDAEHWLGTDDRGRDVAARLIHGAAVSVRVALLAVLLAGVIGLAIGAPAGYVGGKTDLLLSRVIEAVTCFPAFFLIVAVMAWRRPSAEMVILVIALTQWPAIARLARAEFLRLKHAEFVLAARAVGASPLRIMTRHVLPSALTPLLVPLALGVADAVLIEAGLSWLGFGIPTPTPSWGSMLRNAYDHLRSSTYLVFPPCVAIAFSVLAFQWLATGLRRILDPRSPSSV